MDQLIRTFSTHSGNSHVALNTLFLSFLEGKGWLYTDYIAKPNDCLVELHQIFFQMDFPAVIHSIIDICQVVMWSATNFFHMLWSLDWLAICLGCLICQVVADLAYAANILLE